MQVMTSVLHFLLAMMARPEVLAKAQKEIDRVVGSDRLPTFEDRPFLPYGPCPASLTSLVIIRLIHSRRYSKRDLPLGSPCTPQ